MASVSSGQQGVGLEGVATRCGDLSLCSFARACGAFKLMLFPLKSSPVLQSTNIDGNYDYKLVLSLALLRILESFVS